MWLRKQYAKLIFYLCQTYKPDQSGKHERLGLIDSLNPLLFKNYNDAKACTYNITTVYNNIIEYTERLNNANSIMKNRISIPNHWCLYRYSQIPLSKLLLDKRGCIIDAEKAILNYKNSLNVFFQEVERIKSSDNGTDTHNARILNKFQNHILDLTRDIIKFSIS